MAAPMQTVVGFFVCVIADNFIFPLFHFHFLLSVPYYYPLDETHLIE